MYRCSTVNGAPKEKGRHDKNSTALSSAHVGKYPRSVEQNYEAALGQSLVRCLEIRYLI